VVSLRLPAPLPDQIDAAGRQCVWRVLRAHKTTIEAEVAETAEPFKSLVTWCPVSAAPTAYAKTEDTKNAIVNDRIQRSTGVADDRDEQMTVLVTAFEILCPVTSQLGPLPRLRQSGPTASEAQP